MQKNIGALFPQIDVFERNYLYFKCLILDRLHVFIYRDYLKKILPWVSEHLLVGILSNLFSSAMSYNTIAQKPGT